MRTVIRAKGVEFHPNLALNRDLRQSGQMDPALRHHAELLELRAKEIALRVAFDHGDYFASIRAEVGDKPGRTRSTAGRRVGRVNAMDFKAHWIERGWQVSSHRRPTGVRVPGKQVLRKAVRGSGLRYRAPKGLRANQ